MSAGFDPLGDNGINAGLGSRHGFLNRANLDEDLRAFALSFFHIRRRVSPEEYQDGNVFFQTGFDLAFLQEWQNNIDPKRFISQRPQLLNLLLNIGRRQTTHAQHSTAAGIGDRSRQFRPSHAPTHPPSHAPSHAPSQM